MTRKKAIEAFRYWGRQLITPLGGINEKAEKMRNAYAKLIDSGEYAKLPNDALKADEIVYQKVKQ